MSGEFSWQSSSCLDEQHLHLFDHLQSSRSASKSLNVSRFPRYKEHNHPLLIATKWWRKIQEKGVLPSSKTSCYELNKNALLFICFLGRFNLCKWVWSLMGFVLCQHLNCFTSLSHWRVAEGSVYKKETGKQLLLNTWQIYKTFPKKIPMKIPTRFARF